MAKVSLINTNLKSDTVSQKQVALVLMDMMLKQLHKNNYMVRNFDVNNIYFEMVFTNLMKIKLCRLLVLLLIIKNRQFYIT